MLIHAVKMESFILSSMQVQCSYIHFSFLWEKLPTEMDLFLLIWFPRKREPSPDRSPIWQ